jgi:hypothetical protein
MEEKSGKMLNDAAPIVIGATGGSGTRVIAAILRRAGYFFGTNLNDAIDSQEFPQLYDRWINRYVLRDIAPLFAEEEALMVADFRASIDRHRSTIPADDSPWGWKEPRNIYMLPFWDELYPAMKFIHVIRDGRDMAFSANQNQLRKHAGAVLRRPAGEVPDPLRSALLWAALNSQAASYGETQMPGRYLRVRYETLCSDPVNSVAQVFRFLGVDNRENAAELAGEISPAASIGRWRKMADGSTLESIHSGIADVLQRFGY